jgi:hypothetical protein
LVKEGAWDAEHRWLFCVSMSDERIAGLDPGSTFWPPLARTREVAAPDSQAPEESRHQAGSSCGMSPHRCCPARWWVAATLDVGTVSIAPHMASDLISD